MGGRFEKIGRGILWPFRKVWNGAFWLYWWVKEGWNRLPPPVRLYGGFVTFAVGLSWVLFAGYANWVPAIESLPPDASKYSIWPFDLLSAKGYLKPADWVLGPEAVRNLLWGISAFGAAFVALFGLYFAQARKIAADDTHALESKRVQSSHAFEARREQNERFAKAIEMLGTEGDETRPTRLGAIYALGALAIESDEYYGTVLDTLAAFIRDRNSFKGTEDWPRWNEMSTQPSFIDFRRQLVGKWSANQLGPPPTDIIGAIKILSDINVHRNIKEALGHKLDLRGIDLRFAELRDIDLSNFNLRDAVLDFAILENVNFDGADLSYAQMVGGRAVNCSFNKTEFYNTVAVARSFRECSFRSTDLDESIFCDAKLIRCDFKEATCFGMNVTKARFTKPKNLEPMQILHMDNWETASIPKELRPPKPA